MRNHLKKICPHGFGVIDPIPLILTNLEKDEVLPKDSHTFDYDFSLNKTVYVEKADVRKEDEKGFYGCAPNKMVRLRFGPFVKITEVNDHSLKGEIIPEDKVENYKKVKGILHWVGKDDSVECETRIYSRLFNTVFPGKDSGDIMKDLVKDSK